MYCSNKILMALLALAITCDSMANKGADYVPSEPERNSVGKFRASGSLFYGTSTTTTNEYAVFVADNVYDVQTVDPGYHPGFDLSIGYVFNKIPFAVDLFYRDIQTSDEDKSSADLVTGELLPLKNNSAWEHASMKLDNSIQEVDLLFSTRYKPVSHIHIELAAGLGYSNLEETSKINFNNAGSDVYYYNSKSQFSGVGPIFSANGRYGMFNGLGFVGGGGIGYYLGSMDTEGATNDFSPVDYVTYEQDSDLAGVLNLRGHVGVDYQFHPMKHHHTLVALEVGYEADFYLDGAQSITMTTLDDADIVSTTDDDILFSGFYFRVKAVF